MYTHTHTRIYTYIHICMYILYMYNDYELIQVYSSCNNNEWASYPPIMICCYIKRRQKYSAVHTKDESI